MYTYYNTLRNDIVLHWPDLSSYYEAIVQQLISQEKQDCCTNL